ncbi:MAG: BamA/TamA family outer membrane protein [Longimicrobiales bacterium]|nr:BamA/TamA family outer membrane protein [Longimicrobiales bacterium]
MKRLGTVTVFLLVGLAAVPESVAAQYFGRNKVQYDDFDFRILETPHFDIHFYPEAAEAIEDMARMSERWYERFARTFQHEFESSKPLILYADHPDFQQTNTLQGFIGEGTGGVTESLKNRVIMPLTGSYWDNDHVLGHELVHAFQYNIAQARTVGGLRGLISLPLWLVEGMAEYFSVGREDPLTAMWMRDAIRRDDFPTIQQMTREARFFPYRFGQALWAYVGGTYGDDAVVTLFRRSLTLGFGGAIQQVLGVSPDTLSAQWAESVRRAYVPLLAGRQAPDEAGTVIVDGSNAGNQNVSPSVSPDGRYVAFLSEKDLFSVELYLAETETGRIVRKLTNFLADPHSDALRFIDTSGTWSPDGSRFAYVVFAGGDNEIVVVDSGNGSVRERLSFDEIGSISNPAWSPDGRHIAFSGMVGGISDLFLYDFETDELTRLTNDKHADLHPAWSPDGSMLAFASDRGPETDFDKLTFSKFQIATLDLRTRAVRTLPLLGNVRHSNPQFAPDGRTLVFLSDADGFSDIYRTDLRTGAIERVTQVVTGVSGIVTMSPALSMAAGTGDMIFSVFNEFGFTLNRLPATAPATAVAQAPAPTAAEPAPDPEAPEAPEAAPQEAPRATGRYLPPGEPTRFNLVEPALADAETGLPMPGAYQAEDARGYSSSLALDYLGQPQLGVGADNFGNFVAGGASAFFSDMLGNKVLGVALSAQGTAKDIGGAVSFQDLGDRWNWGVGASHVPFQFLQQGFTQDTEFDPDTGVLTPVGDPLFVQRRFRIFQSSVGGRVAYPFSQTQRVEAGVAYTRIAYDVEEDVFFLDQFGRIFDVQRRQRPDLEPPSLNLNEFSLALVGDNSFFGFVSPIRGGRYRFEAEATVGTENFFTATADWRRYWGVNQNLTIGVRALHIGRYGGVSNSTLQPFFLGFESLIRGYAWESFEASECGASALELQQALVNSNTALSACPTFDRLFGQRLAVMNLEARVPFIGTEQFGLFNFPFLPTELSVFFDGGLTWDEDRPADLKFSTSSFERVPVFSTGASARVNILGILVLETYYAYPFQRQEKGWHWGFNIAPGW